MLTDASRIMAIPLKRFHGAILRCRLLDAVHEPVARSVEHCDRNPGLGRDGLGVELRPVGRRTTVERVRVVDVCGRSARAEMHEEHLAIPLAAHTRRHHSPTGRRVVDADVRWSTTASSTETSCSPPRSPARPALRSTPRGDRHRSRRYPCSPALRETAASRTLGPMSRPNVTFSVSTWRRPMPPVPAPARGRDARRRSRDGRRDRRSPARRVAIDEFTAAGKTSLGHEAGCASLGRRGREGVPEHRLDDFKRPWDEEHVNDRTSGEGYYRNAFDRHAACRLLLEPSAPAADGRVALCSIDPLTQIDHSAVKSTMPANGVLIVDGVLRVPARRSTRTAGPPDLARDRCRALGASRHRAPRHAAIEGGAAEAEALHRDTVTSPWRAALHPRGRTAARSSR